MRAATGIKLILLVILGVLTCWTTSSIIARTKGAGEGPTAGRRRGSAGCFDRYRKRARAE